MEIDAVALAEAHPAIGDLPALLEELQRRDRITIGTERAQHAAALLYRLAASGIAIDRPEIAAAWLGPVLCVSARERHLLAQRLRRMAPGLDPEPMLVTYLPGEALAADSQRRVRRRWGLIAAGGLAVIGAMVAVAMLGGDGTAGSASSENSSLSIAGLPIALWMGLPLLLLAVALPPLLSSSRRIVLPPPNPQPTGRGLSWFEEGALQGPLRLLGRQRRAAGRWLDLPETIDRTVNRAGWPTLVRGGRPRTPEHLILAQLSSGNDPQRLVAATILDRLRRSGLEAAAFSFTSRPDWLRPLLGGLPVSLARLASFQRGARLIVISDGALFHDAFQDAVAIPAMFDEFPVRILLTPVPRAAWSWREAALDRAGWRLAEQSTEGLAEVARWLSGPREPQPAIKAASLAAEFGMALPVEASLLTEEPPPAAARDHLQDRLAQWLDPDPRKPPVAFNLFRALAIGSRLPPGTVERVIGHLASLDVPQPDERSLHRLLRLPWLAHGALPSWLREDLLRHMPPDLSAKARQAWLLHLSDCEPQTGVLAPEQLARLAREAGRRLETPQAGADDLMRDALGIARHSPMRPDWRKIAAGLGILAAGIGASWVLVRYGGTTRTIADLLFAPLASLPWLGLPWTPVVAMACAALTLPRQPLVLRFLPGLASLYLLMGTLWLTSLPQAARITLEPQGLMAGAIGASIGLLLLGISEATRVRSGADWAPALPGNPWLNAGAVLLAFWFLFADVSLQQMNYAGSRPPGETLLLYSGFRALIGFALGAVLLRRFLVFEADGSKALWRAALRFAAGGLVADGVLFMASGAGAAAKLGPQLLPTAYGAAPDLALAAGLVAALAPLVPLPWRRISLALALYALVVVGQVALGPSTKGPSISPLDAIPVRLLIAAILIYRPGVLPGRRPLAIMIVLALGLSGFRYLVLSADAAYKPYDTLAQSDFFNYVEWLLAVPLARLMRPDLFRPGEGLWWRCLLLVGCSIGFTIASFRFGQFSLLLIPLAAWIAARHGPRSLPAIALALLPSAIQYRWTSSAFGVEIGGNLDGALVALLVAKFAADRVFREAGFSATSLSAWQLCALAILPLGYISPAAAGFSLDTSFTYLPVAVAALLAMSFIPLRAVLWTMLASTLGGFAITLAGDALIPSSLGTIQPGLYDIPGDVTTVFLALGLFRLMYEGKTSKARWGSSWVAFFEFVSRRPFTTACIVAPTAYLLSISVGGFSLKPFFPFHYLMLVVFWAATDARPTGMPQIRIRQWEVPWTAILVLPLALIRLNPSTNLTLGPLVLEFGGYQATSAAAAVAAVIAFHYLGRGLARLLTIPPQTTPRPHPVFRALPVRIGIGLSVLTCAGLVAFAGVLGVEQLQRSPPKPSMKS